jgi:hypothetical protein
LLAPRGIISKIEALCDAFFGKEERTMTTNSRWSVGGRSLDPFLKEVFNFEI